MFRRAKSEGRGGSIASRRSKKSVKFSPPPNSESVGGDDETVIQSNVPNAPPKVSEQDIKNRLIQVEIDFARTRSKLKQERTSNRKAYSNLIKLASELKRMRAESLPLMNAADYANQTWYEGGLWRAPALLPNVGEELNRALLRQPIGLSDLFVNLVTVLALSRVSLAIAQEGKLTIDTAVYFGIFYTIWNKDIHYKTRFDATDISIQLANLVTSFFVLFGSLSTMLPLRSAGGTNIMVAAGVVAILHLWLNLRVAFVHRSPEANSIEERVRNYALFSAGMSITECIIWWAGVIVCPEFPFRWELALVGILLSIRVPRTFLVNDFNAESTKRGVFFVLLLGFLLYNTVSVAGKYFVSKTPSWDCYLYFGSTCLLLFAVKLLYVDDFPTVAQDHALLVNRISASLYHLGQGALALSTVLMGAGLVGSTESYLSGSAFMPNTRLQLCIGFSAAVLSTFFIKSLHLQRIPRDTKQRWAFFATFILQILVMLGVVIVVILSGVRGTSMGLLDSSEIAVLLTMSLLGVTLVITSWMNEVAEVIFFGSGEDIRQNMVEPFGVWWFLKSSSPSVVDEEITFEDIGEGESTALIGGENVSRDYESTVEEKQEVV